MQQQVNPAVYLQWCVFLLIGAVCASLSFADDFRPLKGQWQRTDGGYVIDIRSVAPDGRMDAAYYNPRTVNVHRAQASTVKGYLKTEIELRDSGYPGSTYTLLYQPDKDALMGIYYQAAYGQTYEVVFIRK
ncbi:hypothetical protein DSCW_22630 [Desulfosarcina widdelii]|uniref:Uncharacterized protein n=1 Tax=Desulfosarcina widdelii TaxID=947919 RepID=A0A5K7YZL9_9BACT|nr:hypothetical protein [Desulfosarcina widdelii]BBO74846.1 hypothetical protein DSCW_22630 [Desulfosarcina widdelii]